MNFRTRLQVLLGVSFLIAVTRCGFVQPRNDDHLMQQDRVTISAAPDPKEKPGGKATDRDIVDYLVGPGRRRLDPADFVLNPDRIERVFKSSRLARSEEHEVVQQFVYFTDVQLRDRTRHYGRVVRRQLDRANQHLQNNFYQDHADVFYFGQVLTAIRQGLAINEKIDFVVHGGDAMQLAVPTELEAFNGMVRDFLLEGRQMKPEAAWPGGWLAAPIRNLPEGASCHYFNVIGNHDVLSLGTFGTWSPTRKFKNSIYSFHKLIKYLKLAPGISTQSPLGPADLPGQETISRGYFFQDRKLADGISARVIFLNTIELPRTFNQIDQARISGEQLLWLHDVLKGATEADFVLVLGHNPLEEIDVKWKRKEKRRAASAGVDERTVQDVLGAYPKVIGYFAGHKHWGREPRLYGADGGFYEFVEPPVQEYPKAFALFTIARGRKHPTRYSIEVQHFNLEDLMDLKALPAIRLDGSEFKEIERFSRWVERLNGVAGNDRALRMKLLASYCYQGALQDRRMNRRKDAEVEIVEEWLTWSILQDKFDRTVTVSVEHPEPE